MSELTGSPDSFESGPVGGGGVGGLRVPQETKGGVGQRPLPLLVVPQESPGPSCDSLDPHCRGADEGLPSCLTPSSQSFP